ncbi:MAG TPA: tetratricopeptide repeat protein [Solirubrobacteraceae bacterium]|nr:tetratricopeptide repeat protein [Solirubrobacteraceae bacterium]
MTSARTLIVGILEALVHAERRFGLLVHRAAGTAHRLTARGWGPVVRWVLTAGAVLYAVDRLGVVDQRLLTAANVVAATGAVLAWRWLASARNRVVIEDFVDFRDGTNAQPQAVKGLSTLLVAELGRLHELYGRVHEQLSTPLSLGVRRRGAAGTEPGSFLSVRADDVTGALNDAVASETRIQVGGINLPVGFLLGLVGRFARGPRIMGSVHPDGTVTAQVVGPGGGRQWQIETRTEAAEAVPELAARMFNDLTLRSAVRTTAMRSFTSALELYWASHSTPRDRARNLRRAEGKLLEAIAEDERFDLAYYNLGVVWSKLAETEQQAAQASEYVGKGHEPEAAHAARINAAVAAFDRAVTLNRDNAEAVYALAVHEFARAAATTGETEADLLDCVVCRCDRVLALDPRHAQAHDLKGMALRRAQRIAEAESSHRRAVVLSWRRVRSAAFAECVAPTLASTLPEANANLAAALHNLARVQEELPGSPRVRLARADRLYRRAAGLAPTATRAAIHHARGRMLDGLGRPVAARECYQAALTLEPENPVYWAAVAAGYAASAETVRDETLRETVRAKARLRAESALHALAPIYRRTLERHVPVAAEELRDGTLETLREAYRLLDDAPGRARVEELGTLRTAIQRATERGDLGALAALKAHFGAGREWEREQVQIALARTLGRGGDWAAAAREYGELIVLLRHHRPQGIVQHSLHAKHARALRNDRRPGEALAQATLGQLQDPLSASARREVGKAHFALRQYEEALEAWGHTLWLTPNDPQLHWRVGSCHWRVAQELRHPTARDDALRCAAECFTQAAALFGAGGGDGWAWSRLWAGRAMAELGEDDEAVRHLRTAASCPQTAIAGSLLLGELYLERGEHEDARRLLADAYRLAREEDVPAHVDANWGDTLPVHEVLRRARALEPTHLAPRAA